jgi:hypothetical protein
MALAIALFTRGGALSLNSKHNTSGQLCKWFPQQKKASVDFSYNSQEQITYKMDDGMWKERRGYPGYFKQ